MNVMHAEPEHRLFTPGPVSIPVRVAAAAAYVNYHHRSASFSAILNDLLANMRPLFGTESAQVMPVHTTGRGALEGVYANLFTSEDQVVSVCNGKFGDMAAKIVKRLGIPVTRCFDDWTASVDLALLEQLIFEQHATAVTVVHSDTSNAVVNPIAEIGKLARKHNLLLIVDAVSSLGCIPFEFDAWGVDAVVTASQKGLMSPPGLSFAVFSERAWQAADRAASVSQASYINFRDIQKNLTKGQTPGTTPVSLVLAVNEAVHMLHEEGLPQVFARHSAISQATKEALVALGFPLFPENCSVRSASLTVTGVPEGLQIAAIVAQMRDKYGILISEGLDDYAPLTLRIAHMGSCYLTDMLTCLTALEATLGDLSRGNMMGIGTKRFLESYNSIVGLEK